MNILSPPSLQHAHTRDFDEQATLLEGWNQHYSQLSSGTFEGAITELVFEDVHLFMEYTSRALHQSGKLDSDTLAVGVPMRHGQGGVFCGTAMKGPAAHLFSGADGFDFYSPTRLLMGGLVVSRHAFQDWLHDRPAVFPDDRARLQTVDPQTLREAGSFLWTVFDLCQRSPQLLERPLFRDRLRNSVFSCLADIADEPGQPANGLSSSQRRSLVQAVRDYVENRPDDPVSIDDVCRDLGVSRRSLQYSFQDTLGINPASFIRARRLNKVREMLREGDSVTEAATAWGFWHFGHFSHEYKKLFGELPSDTLRRHHRS
jgi:AraC family ethanolamine operon transcriptional activator